MFHVSFFFQQSVAKTGGWSENFWNNSDSMAQTKVKAEQLLEKLVEAKGNPVFCPRFRISQVGKFRGAEVFNTNQVPSDSLTDTTEADYPTTKVQVKLKSASTFTNQWFGGLRDRDIGSGGFWTPKGTSVNIYNAVTTILTSPGNAWNIYVLDPANLPFVIVDVNATTGIVTTDGANILNLDKVRVKGVKGIPGINGIWRVTKVADQTYKLQGWQAITATFEKSNASIRKQTYVGQPIASVQYVQSTSHKVGKPTGLLGGRRRKKAS